MMGLSDKIKTRYKEWTEEEYFDRQTKDELLKLVDDEEIADRFYCDLSFGTAGMRGMMGAGTNRMNRYVVRRLTRGLADAILNEGPAAACRGVAIAYDSRRYSAEFATETALALAACGIKAYLFTGLRPTPELSFAVRYLDATCGVMITASHNPKDYNGYKVYWSDGAQIGPEKAEQIVHFVAGHDGWSVKLADEEDARKHGLLISIGREVDEAYLLRVKEQIDWQGLQIPARGGQIRVVYTPLHGTGRDLLVRLFADLGFSSLRLVSAQAEPDGDFPTVAVPNPEDPAAFTLALAAAQSYQADLVLANDPDADRLGVYCRTSDGGYRRFTGNEIGVLLAYYLLSRLQEAGTLPADGRIVKSVVSTALAKKVTAYFGAELIEVPVGFKFIGEQIKAMESSGQGTFLLGFEESSGYLKGTYARDKDGILAAALVSEAALYYKLGKGQTLDDVMSEIYGCFGYFLDEQTALTFYGAEGRKQIDAIMAVMRSDDRRELGGLAVKSREDYLAGCSYDGQLFQKLDFPPADILRVTFSDGGFIMARPSGTEPKIRFYFCISGPDKETAKANLDRVRQDFLSAFSLILKDKIK